MASFTHFIMEWKVGEVIITDPPVLISCMYEWMKITRKYGTVIKVTLTTIEEPVTIYSS